MNFGTLMNYGSVARRVTTSHRCEVLSFKHHEYVAPLPPAQQRNWLARAEREEWSSNQLKAAIAHEAAAAKTNAVELDGGIKKPGGALISPPGSDIPTVAELGLSKKLAASCGETASRVEVGVQKRFQYGNLYRGV
jgi:hypothetical protein